MVSAVLMNISQCVQSEGTNPPHPFLFLITDSVRSLPMELGAMTQGKLHFHKQICVLLNGNALNTEMHLFSLICLRS